MSHFLTESLLDRTVLPLGKMELLPDSEVCPPSASPLGGGSLGAGVTGSVSEPSCMLLNGAALENLEVLDNAEGADVR